MGTPEAMYWQRLSRCMGHGGAPPWVYKNQIATLEAELSSASRRADSALEGEVNRLRAKIRELEGENAELKRELEGLRNQLQK